MNIANELRKLADQIDGTPINTIEEQNIKLQLYEEFLNRLLLIEEHIEHKRARAKDLDKAFIKLYIDDYKLKLHEINNRHNK